MNALNDTIAAIATPPGEGGISVIRLSGVAAIRIADMGFAGRKSLGEALSHTAHFGHFRGRDGVIVDEVVATLFRAPHSYTTEDVVELSCHGGLFITNRILSELIEFGARPAQPGEFTRRAFLNGRIDLSQAEAVADLIRARSRLSHKLSIAQLEGNISHAIQELRKEIMDLSSLIELELDFSDEGIDLIKSGELTDRIGSITNRIEKLLSTFRQGRVFREGVKVVLVGSPNVGKSSILNSLLQYNRAIVSEIPGTTRDTLEENISIDGLILNVIDTAGLRKSTDTLEKLGIMRTEEEIKRADIILYVIDGSVELNQDEIDRFNQWRKEAEMKETKLLVIENKIDLPVFEPHMSQPEFGQIPCFRVSAKSGEGMDFLRKELRYVAAEGSGDFTEGGVTVTNERHQRCLTKAMEYSKNAMLSATTRRSSELIAEDLNMCTKALGEIIGIVTSEDVVNNIFANFCIGK